MTRRFLLVILAAAMVLSCSPQPGSKKVFSAPTPEIVAVPIQKTWQEWMDDGQAAERKSDFQAALAAYREALRLADGFGERDSRLDRSLITLGDALFYHGVQSYQNLAEVSGLYTRALKIAENVHGAESVLVEQPLERLTRIEWTWASGLPEGNEKKARIRRGESYLLRRLAIDEKHGGGQLLYLNDQLARHYLQKGQFTLAERHARVALSLAEKYYARAARAEKWPDPNDLAGRLTLLHEILQKTGRTHEARGCLERTLAMRCDYLLVAARLAESRGDRIAATGCLKAARDLWEKADAPQRTLMAAYCKKHSGTDAFHIPAPPIQPSESALAPTVDPNQGRVLGDTAPYFLYGRIVDVKGNPLEGVVVTLLEWPDAYMGRFTTGKNGEFRFPDRLLYDGQYVVSATKAGYRSHSQSMKRYLKALIVYLQNEQAQNPIKTHD